MNQVFQLFLAGLALGASYALIALGFVIVFKATGVLNFAQGGLLMLGAYLAQALVNGAGLPFAPALALAMVGTGLVGVAIQRVIFQRMIGRSPFRVIMATWALLIVLEQVSPAIWGNDFLNLGDPWGISMTDLGAAKVFSIDLWTLALASLVVASLFAFFQFSRFGVAMRATASDPEAALAQGIDPRLVFALAWFIAGAVACLAGAFLGGGARIISPEISNLALLAFPAVILGGLDSPVGAVIGGLLVGLAEVLTSTFAPVYLPFLGQNLHLVAPYLVLVAVLLLRPYGLFGTAAVRRV